MERIEGNRTTRSARRRGVRTLGHVLAALVTSLIAALGLLVTMAGPAAAAGAQPVTVRTGLSVVAGIAGALIVAGLAIGAARSRRDHLSR